MVGRRRNQRRAATASRTSLLSSGRFLEMKKTLLLAIAVLLSGCAANSLLSSKDLMSRGTAAVIGPDRGLIFGEYCGRGGLQLGSTVDKNLTLVPGWTQDERFFFMSLPAGTYSIASIGWYEGRAVVGRPPLKFSVAAGKATYVGAIYPAWWFRGAAKESCPSDWPAAVKTAIYEQPQVTGKNNEWKVYVLNRADIAVRAIERAYPKVDLSNYVLGLVE
ncbi:exported hypothetical protein [Burkholderiales bacterium]|nr:exported hypothetical protein [Burkholderiales bacterium]